MIEWTDAFEFWNAAFGHDCHNEPYDTYATESANLFNSTPAWRSGIGRELEWALMEKQDA